jgi:phosphoglycolate phosphatase-like HAD superfamily hydrolase
MVTAEAGPPARPGAGSRPRLLLFDIDGTLLACGAQVRPLFAAALVEVFGTTGDVERYDFAGKMDPQIVLELMVGAGLAAERVRRELPRVRDLYVGRLDRGLRREQMRLMPGVGELLGRLAADRAATVGLLTGNWEGGARAKLARFDLNRHFPFGAFGDDGLDRRHLVPAALERAERLAGRRFRREEALIVGDSVLDVDCARAHGVPMLAVATGTTPAERLAAAGADWVAADLSEAARRVPALAA